MEWRGVGEEASSGRREKGGREEVTKEEGTESSSIELTSELSLAAFSALASTCSRITPSSSKTSKINKPPLSTSSRLLSSLV